MVSNALTSPFDGDDVAELALGFSAGCLWEPAMGDQVFNFAFNVKAQFCFYVRPWVRAENSIMPAPHWDLRHVVLSPDGWVALRTLATASV
jgi:hypothetical protein